MITAKEARLLSGLTVEEKIEAICAAIEKAAKDKKRELRTGYDYREDRDLWIGGGYGRTKEWNEAVKILEKLGYKVTFYYNEGQFVDMYTLIKW